MQITREIFDQQRRPRFGITNPERMHMAFWEWMIRGDGMPHRARDLFQVPLNRDDGPIWTFGRMGATRTELSDGRIVCVGGEYEDDYDPDFCIYNDVVVLTPPDRIEIYGYPREVFPPTDFHSASLVGDRIILIGCFGYPDDRRPGYTPVFALDPWGYQITEIETTGHVPGWLFHHEAEVSSNGAITVKGGEVFDERDDRERIRRNFDDFSLDPHSGIWRRLTKRNWRQFAIYRKDNDYFPLESLMLPEDLVPTSVSGVKLLPASEEKPSEAWFQVGECPVSLKLGGGDVEVIVHGDLPREVSAQIADAVRARTEALVQHPCEYEGV